MKGQSHRHEPPEDWVDGSWTVDCVCGVNFDDGEEMVNCDDCGVWVHTRCSRYVKGDELFTCDKCKSKNNRNNNNNNNSEEIEVAQLLVELPTKTIRLETSSSTSYAHPFRLWTEIPMEERVHVQGVPGGEPTLFSGLSSVFTPELWKCTGYVPKKFNFQYREFPCWDEKKEEEGDGRDEVENENTVDKGAGVLFSLSKESVLATTPVTTLVGVRGMDEERGGDRKVCLKEMNQWEGEDREVRRSHIGVKKDRSLFRPVVIHSGKRKKDDIGTSKDRSGKKARAADKEEDVKKRVPHASKTAFTSISDAKTLEFYEDRSPMSFKNDSQSTMNKNFRETVFQERESDSGVAVANGFEKLKNNLAVVEKSTEALSADMSRPSFSIEVVLMEEKASHEDPEAVESYHKEFNVVESAPEHSNAGEVPAKQEEDDLPNGNLDDNEEGSARVDVKLPVEELTSASAECKGNQNNSKSDRFPSSIQANVKVEVDDDNSRGALNRQPSLGDAKDGGMCGDNMSENSKMNDAALNGSPSIDHKAQKADRTLEAVGASDTDKANKLTGDPCHFKQGSERSQDSMAIQKCPSEPNLDSGCAEELSKSGETVLNSPSLPSQHKMVVSVGKSPSASSTVMIGKAPASDTFRSADTLISNPNTKQQVTPDCNSSIKKDRAAIDVLRDEDRHDTSRKTVKECPKSSLNSASKTSHTSKISNTSVPKRTISDSKDSILYSSSKASLAQNSCETAGSLQNEQNKAPASGLPLRGEKINQSSSQSASKANHASSVNHPAPMNTQANLSDEELALLLHQELNSSPRVPRVPRVRHAGSLPHLAPPTATSMLVKRASSSAGKDHSLVSRRKSRDASKDGFRRSHERDDEAERPDRVPSSPDQRRRDTGYTADAFSKREDNGSPTAVHSMKKNIPPASTSTANSGPSSSTEVNDHHLSSARNSPRNISDEETGTVQVPIHRTLPGLISEIMSKGRRMTYEELCNAVLPHWHNLRKHNGERYAYSSHSQAVLDCLRNRHEWALLVDRGPKTSSSRKKRKPDTEESEDNDYGKGRSSKEGEGKRLTAQREDVPKGKRKARKRRRLALQGRGIKDVRKSRKADLLTDDDSGPFSNSSEETLFSEDETQTVGAGPVGSEASASTDGTGTM